MRNFIYSELLGSFEIRDGNLRERERQRQKIIKGKFDKVGLSVEE
jgi:hypothetical protein